MMWFPRYSHPTSPYRAPLWTWASFRWQLINFWRARNDHMPDGPSEEVKGIMNDWNLWSSPFRPELLDHCILHKNMEDVSGEVLEGSYLLIRGYCDVVYVLDDPDTGLDEWVPDHGFQGRRVYMDQRNNCKSDMYLEELPTLVASIDRSQLRKYLCFLIGRERRALDSKTIGLVLAEVPQTEGNITYKRVGILAFDQSRNSNDGEECEWDRQAKWEPKTIRFV